MRFPGVEQAFAPELSRIEKLYVWLWGVPVNGLRIRLRRVLPATRGKYRRILDAGCGRGVFTLELAKQHPEATVVGVDIEPGLVERANYIAHRAGVKNCRFEVADVIHLPHLEQFDLVVSVDNLEHIEQDVEALKALYRALTPSGTLVIHVPGYYRRWLLFGRRVNFDVPGHVRPGYTAEQLVEKLKLANFDVVEYHYTYGLLETFTNNISYMLTGAEQRNKLLYSLVFPFLLALSYLGKFSKPAWGAGVFAKARRSSDPDEH